MRTLEKPRDLKMRTLRWDKGRNLWDLIAYLYENRCIGSNYLFRGQRESEWKLVPSLYRHKYHMTSKELDKKQLFYRQEEMMISAFMSRAATLLPNYPRTPLFDRIMSQHYGVPTQLLDWTIDPLIALYFAVSQRDGKDDCAFYFIFPCGGGLLVPQNISFPYANDITRLDPPIIDDRVRFQKSSFTLQNYGDGEDFTPLDDRTYGNNDVNDIGKVIIPADRRRQILYKLLEIGVDSSLIYPGLQGIGQRVADAALMGNFQL